VFGTDAVGEIGVHHPREIIRIERDCRLYEMIALDMLVLVLAVSSHKLVRCHALSRVC